MEEVEKTRSELHKYVDEVPSEYLNEVSSLVKKICELVKNPAFAESKKNLQERFYFMMKNERERRGEVAESDSTTTSAPPPAPPLVSLVSSQVSTGRIIPPPPPRLPGTNTQIPPPPPPPPGGPGGVPPPPPPMMGLGGGPPPPPPMMFSGIVPAKKEDVDEVLSGKTKETVHIRVGVLKSRRLQKSVFGKENLYEKGKEKYFSDDVKSVLEEKFQVSKKQKKKKKKKKEKKIDKKSDSCDPLIDSSKSLNCSIITSKIDDKDRVIEYLNESNEWLYTTPEGQETCARIRQVITSFSDDEKKLVMMKGKEKGLEMKKYSAGDQFVMKLFQVPCLEIKLVLFEFLETYKLVIFDQVKPEMEEYVKFCTNVRDSQKFKNFLSLTLVITNFLNTDSSPQEKKEETTTTTTTTQNTSRKKKKKNTLVLGISVRSLLNLSRVKNPSNKSESLMDVIYEIILRDDPEMLDFRVEFSAVHKVVEQSGINEKKEALETFEEDLLKVKKKTMILKNKMEEDPLVMKLESLTSKLEEDVESEVKKNFHLASELVEDISDAYGHPKDSIVDFFLVLREFLVLLDRTEEKFETMKKKKMRKQMREARKKERLEKKRKKKLEKDKKVHQKKNRMILKRLLMEARKMKEDGTSQPQEKKKKKKSWSFILGALKEDRKREMMEDKGRVNPLHKYRILMQQAVQSGKFSKSTSEVQKWGMLKGMISSTLSKQQRQRGLKGLADILGTKMKVQDDVEVEDEGEEDEKEV